MLGNFCKRKMTIMSIIAVYILLKIKVIGFSVDAKHHSQPYGDIILEHDENVFQNSFEAKNVENHFELRSAQKQHVANGAHIRGEREKNQYHNIENNYYNRNNRNLVGNKPKGWMVSSSIVELQQDNATEEMIEDGVKHKCNIWVPMDALGKYPGAKRKQNNNIAGSIYIEVCCKGYAPMQWRGKIICRAICNNCQNGRCIAPGMCECYDEYVASDNGDCVFTCPLGCLNGRCYLDGSCQCNPGYKLDESRKFCRPICSKGCGTNRLHNCTEPEVCGCIKGYILTDNDCQPVCQHDCGTGGICRQPDTCECNPGFDLKDGVCQADCYQKCDNGICFSRNRCICNPGFNYHERSTQCIPN